MKTTSRDSVRVTNRKDARAPFSLVEFSGRRSGNGGLIEFYEDEQGEVHVTLYRLDKRVKVQISQR